MDNWIDEVVVLLLNYNSCDLTITAVNTLLKLERRIRVLIVDNASVDDSYSLIHEEFKDADNVTLIKSDVNGGYSNGNNLGFEFIKNNWSQTKYIIIMNPDIIIFQKETILVLYKFLKEHDDYSVVSCQAIFNNKWRGMTDYGWKYPTNKQLFWAGTLLGSVMCHCINNPYTENNLIQSDLLVTTVDVVPGCFFMIKIKDFENIGGFDKRTFLYFEESILSVKLARIDKKEAIILNHFYSHNHQVKDKSLKNYKKRLFDKKCFFESKMLYVRYFSGLKGLSLWLCELINVIDFSIKKIFFLFLAIIAKND